MSNLSLKIFKELTSNPEYHFYEIIIKESLNKVYIKLGYKNDTDISSIAINLININEILNSLLTDNLDKLFIERSGFSYQEKTIISNLPSKLKKFKLVFVDTNLDNLPIGLKVLEIIGGFSSNYCFNYLPSSLKTLVIQSNFSLSFDNLPPTLENLFLLSECLNDLVNLPVGLKFLQLNSQSKINIILPNNMKCIMYPEKNCWLKNLIFNKYPLILHNNQKYRNSIECYD